MPYKSTKELLPAVQSLPAHAKEIFMNAFNAAYDKYGEESAFKIAWAAVKNKYRKEGDRWVTKENVSNGRSSLDITLHEQFADFTDGVSLDKDAGILRNVCLLGPRSRNGRIYTDKAIAGALPFFEAAKCYFNHEGATGQRDVRDLIGLFSGPRCTGGKVFADLKVLSCQKDFLFGLAEQMPAAAGMSINAQGRAFAKDGKQFVEEITALHSVDLVAEPATTSSLFEEKKREEEVEDMDWTKVTIEEIRANRPDLLVSMDKEIAELREQVGKTAADLAASKAQLAEIADKEEVEALLKDLPDNVGIEDLRETFKLVKESEARKRIVEMVKKRVADGRPKSDEKVGEKKSTADPSIYKNALASNVM